MDGGVGLDLSRRSEVEVPTFQDEAFLRGGGHVRILPVPESKSFLEALFEVQP